SGPPRGPLTSVMRTLTRPTRPPKRLKEKRSRRSMYNCKAPVRSMLKMRISVSIWVRSEEHTSELQSPCNLVCRLLLEKKNQFFHLEIYDHSHCKFAPILCPDLDVAFSSFNSSYDAARYNQDDHIILNAA